MHVRCIEGLLGSRTIARDTLGLGYKNKCVMNLY